MSATSWRRRSSLSSAAVAASDFRAYLPRARWIRDANDSYFTAMTYPQALPSSMQPSDIHDATWGLLSAVYGGAIHPTAEGHAAMADAALPAVETELHLNAADASDVTGEPLAPRPLRCLHAVDACITGISARRDASAAGAAGGNPARTAATATSAGRRRRGGVPIRQNPLAREERVHVAANDVHCRTPSDRRASHPASPQFTPSFFCRLDDEVVYWNTSRLSG